MICIILPVNNLDISVLNVLSIHNRHFLHFRRVDLNNQTSWATSRPLQPSQLDDLHPRSKRLTSDNV